MGNSIGCCGGRDEKFDSQNNKHQPAIKSACPSVIYEKTYGENLLFDLKNVIYGGDCSSWVTIISQENLKLQAFEWSKGPKSTVIVLKSEFNLQCDLDEYIYLDQVKFKELNKKVDEIRIVDDNAEFEESVRYISYKRAVLLSNWDFLYFHKRAKTKNEYIEVCKSIEDERVPNQKKYTRGVINLAGQIVQKQSESNIRVRQFVDADVKMNVSLKSVEAQLRREFLSYYDNICKSI